MQPQAMTTWAASITLQGLMLAYCKQYIQIFPEPLLLCLKTSSSEAGSNSSESLRGAFKSQLVPEAAGATFPS